MDNDDDCCDSDGIPSKIYKEVKTMCEVISNTQTNNHRPT